MLGVILIEREAIISLINYGMILLNTIIGILIFTRMLKYVRRELKTAPKYTFRQRSANFLSAVLFSLMVSLSFTFVFALISSSIAINAILAILNIRPDLRGMVDFIRAFQFPSFLPITLFIMGVFALGYSFYEYIMLARTGQEGPMEVQRWIETHFIDRFNPPLSYLAALILFFIIVLLAPTISSYLAIKHWDVPEYFTPAWIIGLILLMWLTLGPIFYLNYYATSGLAQTYFRGRRTNLKKDKKTAIFYILAIISMITTVYGFFKYIPMLFGTFPATKLDPIEAQGEFLPFNLKNLDKVNIEITSEQRQLILMVFAIIPSDYAMFVLTTCAFGLFGFYTKFMSKEPINTPKMVLFAAYIICGISFSIFLNSFVKYPYTFPYQTLRDFGLDLDFSKPQDQLLMVRIFGIALVAEKFLNIIFLINFLIIKKDIRKNADEWVLNKAIIGDDFQTIQKYRNHEDPEMRKLVAESILSYIRIKENIPEKSSQPISNILEELIMDENGEIDRKNIPMPSRACRVQ